MKILLVADQLYHSNNGTTISARRFAVVLRAHGHDVRCVSAGTEKDVPQGETAYLMGKYKVPFFDGLITAQGMVIAKADEDLLREAVLWADVVHFLMPFPLAKCGLKLCMETGTAYTAAFHVQPENISYSINMGRSKPVNAGIYKWMHGYFYKYVKHIHCPSSFIAGELVKNGYDNEIHVVSNGIDPVFVYEKHEKRPELEGKFVILSVGRYSNEKRQDLLLEAVQKSKYSDSIQVVLAGRGPNEKKLARMAKKLANPPIMHFFTKPELLDIMAESDLYVHCAEAEIEAMACMEAFARGLVPVIANSKKSATPQFALTRKCLFRPGDAKNLAAHIDYFIEHEEERKELEHAYAKSAANYKLDDCVCKVEEMFRLAIKENEEKRAEADEATE